MFSRVRRELTLLKSKYQKKLSPRGSTSQRPNSAEPTTVGRSQVSSDCLSVLGGTINSYVSHGQQTANGRSTRSDCAECYRMYCSSVSFTFELI